MAIRKPNLVIAGVVKGGTTSIFSYLSAHPDICVSSVKETCFFHGLRYGYELRPFGEYLSYFRHCENQKYIMEATPGYFEGGARLAQGLKDALGNDLKVILFLRDPVDRLISFFKYKKSMLELPLDLALEDYISHCSKMSLQEKKLQPNDRWWGIEGGKYDLYLEEWLNVFDGNLKILFFDQIKFDVRSLMTDVCEWLDISTSIYDDFSFEVENKTVGYKNKSLQKSALFVNRELERFWRSHPNLKSRLRDFYFWVNGQNHINPITSELTELLLELYRPHNIRTKEILESRNCANLPLWLSQS
jgi:hypothetical protein